MVASEIVRAIDKLGLSAKLMLVEDIWDAIAKGNEELPMPEWQRTELDKRYNDYKCGNLKLHECENVHKSLRNQYK